MKQLRAALAAVLILSAAPAFGQEDEDPWRLSVSDAQSADQWLAKTITGKGPADLLSGSTDLDMDGFPEFFIHGAGKPVLMRLGLSGWTDMAAGALDGSASPDQITFSDEWFNGFQVLRAAGDQKVVVNGVYVSRAALTPSTLDDAAFSAACVKDENYLELAKSETGKDGSVAQFCGCMADGWRERGASQRLLDAFTAELAGAPGKPPEDMREALSTMQFEAFSSCQLQLKWSYEPPVAPENTFNGLAMPQEAHDFADVCAAQDWVISGRKVKTKERAEGLCACIAAKMTADEMEPGQFSLAAALYAGDKSENEVEEVDSTVTEAVDEASNSCLQSLPVR